MANNEVNELFDKFDNYKFVFLKDFLDILWERSKNGICTGKDFTIAVNTLTRKYGIYSCSKVDFEDLYYCRKDGTYPPYLDATADSGYILYSKTDEMPFLFSAHELEFIKLMLTDNEARMFLSDELIEKLERYFSIIDPKEEINTDYITNSFITRFDEKKGNLPEDFKSKLLTIQKAIHGKRKLHCINNVKGVKIESVLCPYKIQYSLREHKFQLISWLESDNRIICQNVSTIELIELCEETFIHDLQNEMRKKLLYIVIDIPNDEYNIKRNAFERCMNLFSSYDKRTFYIEKEDKYRSVIYYYSFDREDLIRDILSLGSTVIIVDEDPKTDPEYRIRPEVIKRLKAMRDNFIKASL